MINAETLENLKAALGEAWPQAHQAFVEEVDQRLARLFSEVDTTKACVEFHSLKGTGAAYGATHLSQMAQEFENQCAKGTMTPAQIPEAQQELERVWQHTKPFLSIANDGAY